MSDFGWGLVFACAVLVVLFGVRDWLCRRDDELARECGAIPPNVSGQVPCHLDPGHGGQHFSTSGCAGSEIRWVSR